MPKPKMKLRKKQVVGQKMVKQGFEVCLKKKKKKFNSHLEAISRKRKEERPKPRKKAYA